MIFIKYFTIINESAEKFEEKKSIFIGTAKRVENEEEAKEFLQKIRLQNREATHNVYAYIIGQNFGIQRYSDDGEPQGTAGIPVLETIKRIGVTDIIVVVTRYFGGILLGAGGLARAYSKAANLAVKSGGIVEKTQGIILDIIIQYDMLGKLQYFLSQNNIKTEAIEYSDKVKLTIYLESENMDIYCKNIINVTSDNCILKKSEPRIFFKNGTNLYL